MRCTHYGTTLKQQRAAVWHHGMMNRYVASALAGTFGTIFHSAVTWTLHPRLPRTRRRPAPPVEITARIAKRIDLDTAKKGRGLIVATGASHFGYGAATGALYPLVADRVRAQPVVTGIAYGLGVWAASYLGWIPAARLLPPATRQPAERNITMILAHVAWGAALGLVYAALRGENGAHKTDRVRIPAPDRPSRSRPSS